MKFEWPICTARKTLQTLEKFIAGNLPQVLLLCGEENLQKKEILTHFAKKIISENLENSARENAEIQIEKRISVDTIFVDKLWQKNVCEDFAEIARFSNFDQNHRARKKIATEKIGVDDVREICARIFQKKIWPFKICLIFSAQRLTDAAQNALLKIFEDPPPKTIFLLSCENPRKLLPTILSRARILNLKKVADAEIRKFFDFHFARIAPEKQNEILQLARGRPKLAEKLLKNVQFFAEKSDLKNAA